MSEVTWQQVLDAERESNRLREEYRLAKTACVVILATFREQQGGLNENSAM